LAVSRIPSTGAKRKLSLGGQNEISFEARCPGRCREEEKAGFVTRKSAWLRRVGET
jgi:hypothetical protein